MTPLSLGSTSSQTVVFSVDSSSAIVVFFSPLTPDSTLTLRFPNSSVAAIPSEETSLSLSDSGSNAAPGTAWVLRNVPTGNWTLEVAPSKKKRVKEPVHDFLPNAMISVLNEGSEEEIFSHLATYDLEKDQTVGVVSRIARGSLTNVARDVVITSAVLDVITPDAKRFVTTMYDDGAHADGIAGDRVFGGNFNASVSGQYKATAILCGRFSDGTPFSRTTSHLMQVVHDDIELASSSGAEVDVGANGMITIRVPVSGSSLTGTIYRTYAEIHADLLPVAWAGGYTPKQCDAKGCFVLFQVHSQWFQDASVPDIFDVVLKHVTIYDQMSNIPVSQRASIRARNRSTRVFSLIAKQPRRPVGAAPSEIMLKGPRPEALKPEAVRRVKLAGATTPTLVLVHGWCAQIQPWEDQPAFTNAYVFKDLNQNRPTAQFAELLGNWEKD